MTVLTAEHMSVTGPAIDPILNEDKLAAVAQKRDPVAFSGLYIHFFPKLQVSFIRAGASFHLAEDLAQQTMLNVWEKATQFDPKRSKASTWIYAIARNTYINEKRSKDRRAPIMEPNPNKADIKQIDPAQSFAEDEFIRDILAKIPEDQAKAVRKFYLEGLSGEETAAELKITHNAVRKKLFSARKNLELILEPLLGAD